MFVSCNMNCSSELVFNLSPAPLKTATASINRHFPIDKNTSFALVGEGSSLVHKPPSYTVYTGFSAKTVYVGNVQIVTCGNMKLKPVLVLQ